MLEGPAVQTSYTSPLLDITGSSQTIAALPEPDSVSQVDPQSLLKLTNRMTHILQAMPSGVVILDANGVISEANPVACQLLEETASLSTLEPTDGRAREQEQGTIKCRTGTAIPMTVMDDPLVASLVGKSWRHVIKQAFLPQNDDGYEVSLHSGRRVSIAIRPLTPEPGQLIVLTDLTETRQLQKNVSHLQRLSALGKMVATLAHQIRTPLAAAILYAENLSHNNIGSEIRERFQQKLMDRLGELEHQVSDMLFMVKGKPQALDCVSGLKGIIDKVLENCAPIAQKQACQLTFHDESQGNIQVNVQALVSAINNVLINSIEAGASQISLHAYDDDSHIVVKIVDDGAGLMQSDQVSTSPFFTTKSQGTGLGLSVVQSVMRQHNGALSLCNRQVKGQTEKGCIVLLRFPKIRTSVEASTVEYSHG